MRVLVYGDTKRVEEAASVRATIAEVMAECGRMSPGLKRHQMLVQAFILTGELVQGLADREFERVGSDDLFDVERTGAGLLLDLAKAVLHSWRSAFEGVLPLPDGWDKRLEDLDGVGPVEMKRPEGYAFYALYPEAYLEAALASGLPPRTTVIGIRSIGTSLGAVVSAGLGAAPAYSVRPSGHPFDRQLSIAPALAARLLADLDRDFAIVDEGPGLSGSSFGCVADWLEARGVASHRIHFFPSHAGDIGPRASEGHRKRWADRPRHVTDLDAMIGDAAAPTHRLRNWVGQVAGVSGHSWQDVSGGGWRSVRYAEEAEWPAGHTQMEKRKFLVRGDGEARLVKFSGLCRSSADKVRRARILSDAGFTPEPLGFCHGFLVERWIDGTPLDESWPLGGRLVDHVGHYLGFRARHLPPPNGGASLDTLCEMAVFNIGQAQGTEVADRLRRRMPLPSHFQRRLRRIDSDNRLHTWEWLVDAEGRIVKTDALDHNAAHDLVGCQDVAWDVAGASAELDLSVEERSRIAEIISRDVDCDLRNDVLELFELCYLGFQIGLWSQAKLGVGDAERQRMESALQRYSRRLDRVLACDPAGS